MPLVESLLRGSQGLGMLHGPRIQGREGFIERSAERGHHTFDARRRGVDEAALQDAPVASADLEFQSAKC